MYSSIFWIVQTDLRVVRLCKSQDCPNVQPEQEGQISTSTLRIVNQQLCLGGKSRCCLAGDIFQCRLPGNKVCNFTMNLSSGDPQPIFSNVALGQHWKILALAHHLINTHCRKVEQIKPGHETRVTQYQSVTFQVSDSRLCIENIWYRKKISVSFRFWVSSQTATTFLFFSS